MIRKSSFILTILLLLCTTSPLCAFEYEKNKLEIFSKLMPRFVLMSSKKKTINQNIQICLISEINNDNYVNYLQEKLEKNSIKNIKNEIIKTNYQDLEKCKDTDISFMFNTDKETIINTVKFFDQKEILTISYNPLFLHYDINISIFFGRKVVPYLNVKSMSKNNIVLDNILLRISKIFRENINDK